jgi:MarR family transcriptional regulator, organic hydroperoxide resistance regulator
VKGLRQGGFLMAKIRQVSERIFARKLKEYRIDRINPAQGRILFVLWQQDGIPIQQLAKRTQLGKSTLTSMLDRLEKAGHLARVRSTKDRRQILIKRTQKDKHLERIYSEVSQQMTEVFYAGFSPAEIERFEKDLEQILNNLISFEKHNSSSSFKTQ